MQFVRQSKFRHVYCKPVKREFCLDNVRVTTISWESLFCAVNPKFIAIITEGAGGPFIVVPLTKVGKIDKDFPVVDAHKAPCLELAWCQFDDNVIASCSDDCTAKVWRIPEYGLRTTLNEPLIELRGHNKRVTTVVWHPTASNILLTAGGDCKIFLWDVSNGETLIEIDGHPDIIWSVCFNYNGSKILTACKDKKLRVINPRTGEILQEGFGHEGVKPQKAVFVCDDRILSTGFTKRSERMYALRDESSIDTPIVEEELDRNNGVMFPFYDHDTSLLYLCGKGDSVIRYYEVNNEAPFVHYINTYSTPEPQRGIGFMPKRGMNIYENEIARIYKCTNRGLVEVLQFFVPRKSDEFQEDLYPDTAGPVPAMTADEWFNGKDADPVLMPLRKDVETDRDKQQKKGAKRVSRLTQSAGSHETERAKVAATEQYIETIPDMSLSDRGMHAAEFRGGLDAIRKYREPARAPEAPQDGIVDAGIGIVPFRRSAAVEPTSRERPEDRFGPHSEAPVFRRSVNISRSEGGEVPGELRSGKMRCTNSRSQEALTRDHGATGEMASAYLHVVSGSSVPDSSLQSLVEELVADVNKLKEVVRRQERRLRYVEQTVREKDIAAIENAL